MLRSAPQMGTHVQPAYVEQLFGGMGYGSGKVGGKAMESWRGGGAGEMCLCLFVCVLWGHHASVIFRAQLKLMSYFCVCSGVSSPVQKF